MSSLFKQLKESSHFGNIKRQLNYFLFTPLPMFLQNVTVYFTFCIPLCNIYSFEMICLPFKILSSFMPLKFVHEGLLVIQGDV